MGSDEVQDVQGTTDGGCIIVGYTGSFPGSENIYLLKVDASGKKVWEKVFGGEHHEYGTSVKQAKDGGFIVLGFISTGVMDVTPFYENMTAWLIKTDTFGEKAWERLFEQKKYVWGSDVYTSDDGGFIVVGGEKDENGCSIYVIKIDSGGNTLWKKTLGNNLMKVPAYLLSTDDGGYILIGITTKEEKWGDIYMAKLGPERSEQQETRLPVIKVYLNEKELSFDVPPVIADGRVLVPFRAIGEALGAVVDWDGIGRTATLIRAETIIKLIIGDPAAFVNGEAVKLEKPAGIVNGRVLVPLRFVGESLGADTKWEEETRTVKITVKS